LEDPSEIHINTLSDLQRLSYLEIKNLPLGKCKGDVFESALKQAIELEKEGTVKHQAAGVIKGDAKTQIDIMNSMVPFIQKHH
jgi:hypothetical protein